MRTLWIATGSRSPWEEEEKFILTIEMDRTGMGFWEKSSLLTLKHMIAAEYVWEVKGCTHIL